MSLFFSLYPVAVVHYDDIKLTVSWSPLLFAIAGRAEDK